MEFLKEFQTKFLQELLLEFPANSCLSSKRNCGLSTGTSRRILGGIPKGITFRTFGAILSGMFKGIKGRISNKNLDF